MNKILKFFAIFLLLSISGCQLAQNNGNNIEPTLEPTRPVTVGKPDRRFEAETFFIDLYYDNDVYSYYGVIQVPTPCHEVEIDTLIAESFPEQVTMNFTIVDSGKICAQVIAEKSFSGEIDVDEAASFKINVSGEQAHEIEPEADSHGH